MKHPFLKYSFFLIFFCGSLITNAQQRALGTPTIKPVQPNSNDSIIVIIEVGSSTTPCGLDSFAINTVDSTITIDAYYVIGLGQGSCMTKDTITLGQLLPKRYKLKYNAINNVTPFVSVSDSLYFTVNQVIGISERNNPIESASVYPNPSKEEINLKLQLSKALAVSIRIIDLRGKIAYEEQVNLRQGNSVHAITTKTLPSGIYTLTLWNAELLLKEEKVIVQH